MDEPRRDAYEHQRNGDRGRGGAVHTIIVVSLGFALLVGSLLGGRLLAGMHGVPTAALAFLPLWFLAAALNMFLGVKKAGYTVAQEAPRFVLVFGLPALAAVVAWWLAS
jgi:hypothetical protein